MYTHPAGVVALVLVVDVDDAREIGDRDRAASHYDLWPGEGGIDLARHLEQHRDNPEGEFCKRATYRPTSRDGASELRLSPIPDTPQHPNSGAD